VGSLWTVMSASVAAESAPVCSREAAPAISTHRRVIFASKSAMADLLGGEFSGSPRAFVPCPWDRRTCYFHRHPSHEQRSHHSSASYRPGGSAAASGGRCWH